MKTVVLQTYTGKGYLGHKKLLDSDDININRQIMAVCMKSVKIGVIKIIMNINLKDIDLGELFY